MPWKTSLKLKSTSKVRPSLAKYIKKGHNTIYEIIASRSAKSHDLAEQTIPLIGNQLVFFPR